jgi:hypothetical protein
MSMVRSYSLPPGCSITIGYGTNAALAPGKAVKPPKKYLGTPRYEMETMTAQFWLSLSLVIRTYVDHIRAVVGQSSELVQLSLEVSVDAKPQPVLTKFPVSVARPGIDGGSANHVGNGVLLTFTSIGVGGPPPGGGEA